MRDTLNLMADAQRFCFVLSSSVYGKYDTRGVRFILFLNIKRIIRKTKATAMTGSFGLYAHLNIVFKSNGCLTDLLVYEYSYIKWTVFCLIEFCCSVAIRREISCLF